MILGQNWDCHYLAPNSSLSVNFSEHHSAFADNTKLDGIANTLEDRNKLQSDLDRLEHWAENNRMKFNRDKCQVLHLGKRNQMHSYKMGDTWLSNTTSKKDLGIVVDHKLNISVMWLQKKQMLFWAALIGV